VTYFEFLLSFLVLPIVLLGVLVWRDRRRRQNLPLSPGGVHPWIVLGLLIVVAVIYTTPWDNYLVATQVWWYDRRLVTGITFGWVPLEEYVFIVLQPILIVLWSRWVARRAPMASQGVSWPIRLLALGLLAGVWIAALVTLVAGWRPGRYLGLELVWAALPLFIQLTVGLRILAQQRWLLALIVIPVTLYLSVADSLAISTGIWTISPATSLGVRVGKLPLEECFFFLLTTTLVSVGYILATASDKPSLRHLTRAGKALR
jgi:lycopene cyclase domain-containing protein